MPRPAHFQTIYCLLKRFPETQNQYHLKQFQFADAGGNLPVKLANQKIASSLDIGYHIRNFFQQDDKIDENNLQALKRTMEYNSFECSAEEEHAIIRAKVFYELCNSSSNKFELMESPDDLVSMKGVFLSNDNTSVGVGESWLRTSSLLGNSYQIKMRKGFG